MKTACLILALGKKYESLGLCAKNSFKKFHPDVDLFYITDENAKEYKSYGINGSRFGWSKLYYAMEIMSEHSYNKMICLGADTITCSRLDEFLDNNKDDVICTLDHNIQYTYFDGVVEDWQTVTADYVGEWIVPKCKNHIFSPIVVVNPQNGKAKLDWTNFAIMGDDYEDYYKDLHHQGLVFDSHTYLNADVICFNNVSFLRDLLCFHREALKSNNRDLLGHEAHYGEQGLLNFFVWGQKFINIIPLGKSVPLDILRGVLKVEDKTQIYKTGIPEFSYVFSDVVYNVRSKSLRGIHPKPEEQESVWSEALDKFYIKNDKLYCKEARNMIDKQIKVWHYCCGLGTLSDSEFEHTVNKWAFEYFNKDTHKFFTEQCDCGDFFQKEFKI